MTVRPGTRRLVRGFAALVLLAGVVFALQGLRVLPSAVMYGKPEWVAIGAAMTLVAGGALWRLRR